MAMWLTLASCHRYVDGGTAEELTAGMAALDEAIGLTNGLPLGKRAGVPERGPSRLEPVGACALIAVLATRPLLSTTAASAPPPCRQHCEHVTAAQCRSGGRACRFARGRSLTSGCRR